MKTRYSALTAFLIIGALWAALASRGDSVNVTGSEGIIDINREAPIQASAEVFIDAAPDAVWSTLANIESWPSWNPDVKRASLHGPLESGTGFSWKAGGMSIESELLDVSRPALLAWRGVTIGTRAVHVSRFTPEAGGTRAVTEESFEGFLPWLLRGPMRKMLGGSLSSGLDALKLESERRAKAEPPN